MKKNIKWGHYDNIDQSSSLKQHAFTAKTLLNWRGEYESNISLCGRITIFDGNELPMPFVDLDSDPISEHCCKNCLKAFKILNN